MNSRTVETSCENNYLNFTPVNEKNKILLRNKFLKNLYNSGEKHLINLKNIIENKKNKIKLKIYTCFKENIYKIIISCHIDSILLYLANKYNFPRGFPILWIPDKRIKLFGFYPKFDNDDQQQLDKEGDFHGIKEISFFKKWSGFLGQVCVYKIEDSYYWSCCSKNSGDINMDFVSDCKRLFKQILNDNIIKFLADNNYHICAEMMSKNDQTHGARVLNESPIITSIGKGTDIYFDNNKNNLISINMVDFLTHNEVVDICTSYNLPCDSAIIINDENAINFMVQLSNKRDFMTNNRLDKMLEYNQSIIQTNIGTREHKNILGDILEGLVIKIKYKGEKPDIIKKYKFPNYTVRTMAIRTAIQTDGLQGLIKENILSINNFAKRWCVSEKGREFWDMYLKTVAYLLKIKGDEFISKSECYIGSNILICDYINEHILLNELETNINNLIEYKNAYENVLENLRASTVIITIGPIGIGKSTISEKIKNLYNNNYDEKLIHIDGDKLDMNMNEVLLLKSERNNYSLWLIIKALMEKKIPIISTGGGILFDNGKNLSFNLRRKIMEILQIDVKIILLIPNNEIDNLVIKHTIDTNNKDIQSIYDNNDIENIIISRINRNEWVIPKNFHENQESFIQFINNKSKNNFIFANILTQEADIIISYPIIKSINYNKIKNTDLNIGLIKDKILYNPCAIPNYGYFKQYRILAKLPEPYNYYHHITIAYDNDRQMKLSLSDFNNFNKKLKNNYQGALYKLKSINYKHSIEFIIINIPNRELNQAINNGAAHITINSGNHKPELMKNMTNSILYNNSITIKDKSDNDIYYDIKDKDIPYDPITINIHSIFAI